MSQAAPRGETSSVKQGPGLPPSAARRLLATTGASGHSASAACSGGQGRACLPRDSLRGSPVSAETTEAARVLSTGSESRGQAATTSCASPADKSRLRCDQEASHRGLRTRGSCCARRGPETASHGQAERRPGGRAGFDTLAGKNRRPGGVTSCWRRALAQRPREWGRGLPRSSTVKPGPEPTVRRARTTIGARRADKVDLVGKLT
jgi:hypothetical protein